jgi:hypothetical protein
MTRLVFRLKLLLILLTLSAIVILPSPESKAQCNATCGKVKGKNACIRVYNSTGDPIELGTDCAWFNGNCITAACG